MANSDLPDDPQAEVNELRDRVAALSSPIEPVLANATAKAQDYAHQAKQTVTAQTETVAKLVRGAPFKALLAACAAGYVIGRIVR